jgi:hypothetical protein
MAVGIYYLLYSLIPAMVIERQCGFADTNRGNISIVEDEVLSDSCTNVSSPSTYEPSSSNKSQPRDLSLSLISKGLALYRNAARG